MQIAQTSVTELLANLADNRDFARADHRYLNRVLNGVVDNVESMREKLTPLLDRPWNELSPVERAVLLIACYELSEFPDIPYRVVINEAVELAKSFGGTDGHKYVNGVLDRASRALRPAEVA